MSTFKITTFTSASDFEVIANQFNQHLGDADIQDGVYTWSSVVGASEAKQWAVDNTSLTAEDIEIIE